MKISIRNIARSIRIIKKAYSNIIANTYYYQKYIWQNKLTNYGYDTAILYGYEWGDPDSVSAFEYNSAKEKIVLGNYFKIKNEYLLPLVAKDKVVLELGSLAGKWTQFLKDAERVICADINDKGFEYIKKKLPYENITFYLSNGNELNGIASQSVDVIFSIDTLVRVKKKFLYAYFSEFARVLKPGGKMLLHLPCSEIQGSRDRNFVKLKREDIVELCNNNGFIKVEIDDKTITHGVILRCNYYGSIKDC